MNLKLKWTNLNTVPVTVKIYRGLATIDRANLGTALVTLSAGETEWIDTTAIRGTIYYYVFETISATDRSVSQNQKVYANNRRGPGPQILLQGDMEYGYFGEMLTVDFIDTNTLRAALGMAVGTVQVTNPTWEKWVRKGKILITPSRPPVTGISWTQLYNLGLVYGTDDNGKGTFIPAPPVNQKRTIKIGADTYIVRLMTGYSDNVADIPSTAESTLDPTDTFSCEWEDLTFPLLNYTPTKQRMANVQNYTPANLFLTTYYNHLVQERCSATQNLIRGDSASTRASLAKRSVVLSSSVSVTTWWPVFELVESAV